MGKAAVPLLCRLKSDAGTLVLILSTSGASPTDDCLQPYQVSLAWLLARPAVASAIVGAETAEEVTANATAADVTLDQAQLDALTALPHGQLNETAPCPTRRRGL
jgi:aryl-alcohol dehydrogenase-like predicted oxidoreductase